VDTKSQRNLNKITTDLKDIERIMVKNVQDILGRGAKINGTQALSSPTVLSSVASDGSLCALPFMCRCCRKDRPISCTSEPVREERDSAKPNVLVANIRAHYWRCWTVHFVHYCSIFVVLNHSRKIKSCPTRSARWQTHAL
jgi:hypothetical protein